MLFSKRSLGFASLAAVALFQHTTAEIVVQTNLRRTNVVIDEAIIPMEMQEMATEEVSLHVFLFGAKLSCLMSHTDSLSPQSPTIQSLDPFL